MRLPWLWLGGAFAVAIVVASLTQWTSHHKVLHQLMWRFRQTGRADPLAHRQTFKADAPYHLLDEKDVLQPLADLTSSWHDVGPF